MELIGDKKYVNSVIESNGLWVLMSNGSVYMLKASTGFALPTWTSKDEAAGFCNSAKIDNFKPAFIPLPTFVEAWLESNQLDVVEVLASPKYNFDALSYNKDELVAKFKT